MSSELSIFEASLQKLNETLEAKLNAKHVGFRNSTENQDITLIQIQIRILEKKIKDIEEGRIVDAISEIEPTKTETTLDQQKCEGKGCSNPTKDPSHLCLICKTKKDNPSKIPEHG